MKNSESFKQGNYKLALEENFLRMDDLLNTDEGKKELSRIKKSGDSSEYQNQWQQESFAGCTANVALLVNR
jgi:hypothetical protein